MSDTASIEENKPVDITEGVSSQSKDIEELKISHPQLVKEKKAHNIHFKETVPIHALPDVHSKFQRKSDISPEQEQSPVSSDSEEYLEFSRRLHKLQSCESSSSEDSLQLHIRLKKLLDECYTSTSSPNNPKNTLSYETLKKNLDSRLQECKSSSESLQSPCSTISGSSSSGSTVYKELPECIPEVKDYDAIKENLRKLEENRKRLLKLGLSKKEEGAAKISSFKTPPKFYSEDIKMDTSNEKMLSRRKRGEMLKKQLLENYMKRLLQLKKEQLDSESSVEDSGIEMNTVEYSKLLHLQKTRRDSSKTMSVSSDSSKHEICSPREIPTDHLSPILRTNAKDATSDYSSCTCSKSTTSTDEQHSEIR